MILMIAICLQCTSCVYVQDAMYDMGIYIDFDEAWEDIQTEWGNVSSNVSQNIRNTIDDAMDAINSLFHHEELPDTAIEIEESEYYLDFPLEKIYLPASQRTVFLLPLHGYGEVSAYRRSDNKKVSLADAGLSFSLENTREKFTLDEYGTICGRQCGMGYFSVTYTVDGVIQEQIDNVAVFVAECDFSETDTFYTFSAEERDYIVTCLDLSYTLYKVQETSSMLEWSLWDNILLNINNLSDNLAAVFKWGESMQEAQVKRVFSDFFKKYINTYVVEPKQQTGEELELLKEAVNGVLWLADTIKNPVGKFEEAVVEAATLFGDIGYRVATREEYKRMTELLDVIYSDIESYRKCIESAEGREELMDLLRKYEPMHKVAQKFRFKMSGNLWQEFYEKAFFKDGKLDKLSLATEVITAGFNLFDAVSYAMYDYDNDITYLTLLRDGMNEYKKTLSAEDDSMELEIKYIDELIADYTNSKAVAVHDFFVDSFAQLVELLAGTCKVYSLIMFIVNIGASQSNVSDVEKVTILSLYASGAFHTLDPIHDLFMNGDISGDYHELRYSVSLYLNLLLEINQVMLGMSSGEDRKALKKNIDYIEKTLFPYLRIE